MVPLSKCHFVEPHEAHDAKVGLLHAWSSLSTSSQGHLVRHKENLFSIVMQFRLPILVQMLMEHFHEDALRSVGLVTNQTCVNLMHTKPQYQYLTRISNLLKSHCSSMLETPYHSVSETELSYVHFATTRDSEDNLPSTETPKTVLAGTLQWSKCNSTA